MCLPRTTSAILGCSAASCFLEGVPRRSRVTVINYRGEEELGVRAEGERVTDLRECKLSSNHLVSVALMICEKVLYLGVQGRMSY